MKNEISSISSSTNTYYQQVLALFIANDHSDETNPIQTLVKPKTIRILIQPDSYYNVKDLIRIKVATYATTKSALGGIPIKASISPIKIPID